MNTEYRTIVLLNEQILVKTKDKIYIKLIAFLQYKERQVWLFKNEIKIVKRKLTTDIKIPYSLCKKKRIPTIYFRKYRENGKYYFVKD